MDAEAFLRMSYGIYMISAGHEGQKSAYIANTAFQVTSDPPRIAISCHKDNNSANIIEKSGIFAISVLAREADAGLIGLFGFKSGNEKEKFDRVSHITGVTGAPVITTHAVAYLECRLTDRMELGTHILFVGEVVDAKLLEKDKEPLTYAYYRDELQGFAPERAPTYIDRKKLEAAGEDKEAGPAKGSDDGEPQRYICTVCGYVYDPEKGDEEAGIPPGTRFEDLPEDYVCPVCDAAKSFFISEN